jgi:hypothetical protein
MTLTCKECGMEIKIGKTVWFMEGHNYHPECIMDNPGLYKRWRKEKEVD